MIGIYFLDASLPNRFFPHQGLRRILAYRVVKFYVFCFVNIDHNSVLKYLC